MMSLVVTLLALTVCVPALVGASCTTCKTTYDTAVAGTPTEAVKCTAVKAYASCLTLAFQANSAAAGCDQITTRIGEISSAIVALASLPCTLTPTCGCQTAYAGSVMTTTDQKCSAAAQYSMCVHAISTTTELGCATTANGYERAVARQKVTTACTCAATPAAPTTGETCAACKTTYDTAISGAAAAAQCTAGQAYASCLTNAMAKDSTATGCSDVITKTGVITALMASLTAGGNACSLTATCSCQIAYHASAMTSNDLKCSAASTFLKCAFMQATSEAACVSGQTNADIRVMARAKFSTTCMCNAGEMLRFSATTFFLVLVGIFMNF